MLLSRLSGSFRPLLAKPSPFDLPSINHPRLLPRWFNFFAIHHFFPLCFLLDPCSVSHLLFYEAFFSFGVCIRARARAHAPIDRWFHSRPCFACNVDARARRTLPVSSLTRVRVAPTNSRYRLGRQQVNCSLPALITRLTPSEVISLVLVASRIRGQPHQYHSPSFPSLCHTLAHVEWLSATSALSSVRTPCDSWRFTGL